MSAAIGATGDFLERAQELAKAKVDVLAIDSAHGHSSLVLEAVKKVKATLPEVELIAGNVATFDGACDLVQRGRGRSQGRHRPGLDLHHPHRHRRWSSADHGDCRSVAEPCAIQVFR